VLYLLQNGFVESFNGRLRDDCLNETLFTLQAHARFVLAALVRSAAGAVPIADIQLLPDRPRTANATRPGAEPIPLQPRSARAELSWRDAADQNRAIPKLN